MSQDQILDFLKGNPRTRFTARDIMYSIPKGIKKNTFYTNMKRLEKMDCIRREGVFYYYLPR